MARVLVIDNYDSFVYTLVSYLRQLGAETTVIRNDDVPEDEFAAFAAPYDGVLVSPGPGTPEEAGVSITAVQAARSTGKPLLGVCLGHQAIGEAFGGVVTNAEELMHGKTSRVRHADSELFADVPEYFNATRYHSLAIVNNTLPDEIRVTARTEGGVIMALEHTTLPIFGVQFHPESVVTEGGFHMLANWLQLVGVKDAVEKAASLSALPLQDHLAVKK